MKKLKVLLFSLVLIAPVMSCAPGPEGKPQETPMTKAAVEEFARPTPESWSDQSIGLRKAEERKWERTVSQAKKEEKIILYGSFDPSVRTALIQAVKEKFGLDMEAIQGRGPQIIPKLLAERKAGIYNADVYIGGTNPMFHDLIPAQVLDFLEPVLFLPDVLNPKNWLNEELPFLDKEKRVLAMSGFPSNPMAINTELVREGEIKTYQELLNPKWKGMVIMLDPTTAGFGLNLFRLLGFKFIGLDYWKEMVKQELVIVRDQRTIVEFVARGKKAIGLAPSSGIIKEFQAAGSPVKRIIPSASAGQSGLNTGSGAIAYINNSPHPQAANLFINWLLTKEGQTIFSKASSYHSRRLDASTGHLSPEEMRQHGIKYFNEDDMEWMMKQPEHLAAAIEILGPLLSR